MIPPGRLEALVDMVRAVQRKPSDLKDAAAVPRLDRESHASAQTVMERACPNATARRFLMTQLLESIAIAEKAGPNSCAVTLFEDGFRLNVGQVEAFTYRRGLVYFFMLGSVPARAHTVGEIIPSSFRSMPQPQNVFIGGAKELQRMHAVLAPAHKTFLRTAAVTTKGKPRRASYSRFHSPGLFQYAIHLGSHRD
jgi:hypothetical protein